MGNSQEAQQILELYESYILKSYATFLESAGARVVPLVFHGDHEAEMAKLQHLNGVFLPGGDGGSGYYEFAKKVYEWGKA